MLEKLKSFLVDDTVFYGALLVLVAVASFGLGRLSVIQNNQENQGATVVHVAPPPKAAAPTTTSTTSITSTKSTDIGEVVASKSGTKYHLPTCAGANQIKPENLITFPSRAAAEAVGYTPAANCPGL